MSINPSPASGNSTSSYNAIQWILSLFLVLFVAASICLYYWLSAPVVSFSLGRRLSTQIPGQRGFLRAVESLEIKNAKLNLKPGQFRIRMTDHNIDVNLGSEVTINILRLRVGVREASKLEKGKESNLLINDSGLAIELQEIDLKTNGQLTIAMDKLPAIPIDDIQVHGAENSPTEISAKILFARLIGSILTDVVYAPLTHSGHTEHDVEARTESANVELAVVHLRSGAQMPLPDGFEVTVGDSSKVRIANLNYDTSQGEKWQAEAELDLAFGAPTVFKTNQFAIEAKRGRINVSVTLNLRDEKLSVALKHDPAPKAMFSLNGGLFKNASPAWQAELNDAKAIVEAVSFTGSRKENKTDFSFAAKVTASGVLRWEDSAWRGSGQFSIDKLKVAAPGKKEKGDEQPAQIIADAKHPASLKHLTLVREMGTGKLEISLNRLDISGSVKQLLSVVESFDQFKALGGKVTYKATDGTTVEADFVAGGTISRDSASVAPLTSLAIHGTASLVELTNSRHDKLQLKNVVTDIKSFLGNKPGIVLSCRGDVSVSALSQTLAISGTTANIEHLDLTDGGGGNLKGKTSIRFSIPTSEVQKLLTSELSKARIIKGGSVGKILVFDGTVSDISIIPRGITVAFVGPAVTIAGKVSVHGKLTTSRRIVVDFLGRHEKTIVNHNPITVEAAVNGSARVVFPPAVELSKQQIELHCTYQEFKLSSPDRLLNALIGVFGINSKLKSVLPPSISLSLYKGNDIPSVLRKIHNPRILLSTNKDRLVLIAEAVLEF